MLSRNPSRHKGREEEEAGDFTLLKEAQVFVLEQPVCEISDVFFTATQVLDELRLLQLPRLRRAQPIFALSQGHKMASTDRKGITKVHTHASNRAKNKQGLERKPMLKPCLSNPFEIDWSVHSISLSRIGVVFSSFAN